MQNTQLPESPVQIHVERSLSEYQAQDGLSENQLQRLELIKQELTQAHAAAVKHRVRGARRTKAAGLLRTIIHVLDACTISAVAVQIGQEADNRTSISLWVTAATSSVSAILSAALSSLALDQKASADHTASRVLSSLWSWYSNRILANGMSQEDIARLWDELSGRMSIYRDSPEAIL
jgi:hypothetical protein